MSSRERPGLPSALCTTTTDSGCSPPQAAPVAVTAGTPSATLLGYTAFSPCVGLGLALEQIPALLDADGLAPLLATARMQRERVEQELTNHERLRSRLDEVIRHLEHDRLPPTDDFLDTLETMAMTVHLTRIYTRLGDDGATHLADLSRAAKTDPWIEAVGAVDELKRRRRGGRGGRVTCPPGTPTG